MKEFEAIGVALHQAYGLTESCGPGTLLLAQDAEAKVGSCGKPQMHTEAKVVDDKGNEVNILPVLRDVLKQIFPSASADVDV